MKNNTCVNLSEIFVSSEPFTTVYKRVAIIQGEVASYILVMDAFIERI